MLKRIAIKFFYLFRVPFLRNFQNYESPLKIPQEMIDDIKSINNLISRINDNRCKQFLKILLAAKLRYGNSSYDFKMSAICQSYLCKRYKKQIFCSELEPVIHLANDVIELKEINPRGNIHCDFDASTGIHGSNIIWIPVTNYDYPGIVMMPWLTQILTHLFFFVPNIFSLLKILQREIPINRIHEKGKWLEWNDSFLHGGIPNLSNQTAIALVIRVSKVKSISTPDEIFLKNFSRNKKLIKKKKDVLEVNNLISQIDEVLGILESKKNSISQQFLDSWLQSSVNKFTIMAKKKNSSINKYVLNFWKVRKEIIFDESKL